MTDNASLPTKINQETARYPWRDLLKYFASGTVIEVQHDLDLVAVACLMAEDRASEIQALLHTGKIARMSDQQAQNWLDLDLEVWTVVVKPWILVQYQSETGVAADMH